MESVDTSSAMKIEGADLQCNILERLPNEAVLIVLRHLDASSLKTARSVCQQLNTLIDEPSLWKKLCKQTGRVVGELTLEVCERVSEQQTWQYCYYWITSKDVQTFASDQDVIDFANSIETDADKRYYIFARAIDLQSFPKSPTLLQHFADFLVEQPNRENSWDRAKSYYLQSLSLAQAAMVAPDVPQENEAEVQQRQRDKTAHLYCLLRYAHFLAQNCQLYDEADRYYRKLIQALPSNTWVFERYAEFVSEYLHKFDLAVEIYRMILASSPSGSSVASYAYFLWHIRRNYMLAGKCFKVAMELNPDKAYFYANFLGRHAKDEVGAKKMLLESRLYQQVQENPKEEQALFSLALAFHQIHCVDEAEDLYRQHLALTVNVYTLSNLAELLVHSRGNFEEAEQLYKRGHKMISGAHDTIEVALTALSLCQDREGALEDLEKLLSAQHIRVIKTTWTEGWIYMFIHSKNRAKKTEALVKLKTQLVTLCVRPKLILMFDANLAWAQKNLSDSDYEFARALCAVYNCEAEVETLDYWPQWKDIEVEPCSSVSEKEEISDLLLEYDDEEDDEEDEGEE